MHKGEIGSGSDEEEDIGVGKLRIEVGQVVERAVSGRGQANDEEGMRSHRSE